MPNQKCVIALIALSICLSISNWSSQTAYTQAATSSLPAIEWTDLFGLGYYNTAHQIIQTQDGGYAVTGMYGRSNPLNVTLVKYNANGNLQWYQSYELQFINYPMNTAFVQTNDSGYAIIGNKYQTLTLTLIKIDANGTIQWNETYPGNYLAWGMTQTKDGGYLITSCTSILTKETYPTKSELLIKTDASGKVQWQKSFKTGNLYTVAQANDGNYVAVGANRLIKLDTSGNILWDKELPPVLPNDPKQYRYSANDIHALTKTTDSGYALAGHVVNENYSNEETSAALLIKTDSKGVIQWNKTYGAEWHTWAFSVAQTSDSGYILAGTANIIANSSLNNFFQTNVVLIRTDENGNEQWTQTFGDSQSTDRAFSVIESSDGGFALAGQTKPGTTYNESYYYIAKTKPMSAISSPTPNSSTGIPLPSMEILAVIVAILAAIICTIIIALFRVNRVNSGLSHYNPSLHLSSSRFRALCLLRRTHRAAADPPATCAGRLGLRELF